MEKTNKNHDFIACSTDKELKEYILNGSIEDALSVLNYFLEHGTNSTKTETLKLILNGAPNDEIEYLLKSETIDKDKLIDFLAHSYDSFGELLNNRLYKALSIPQKMTCLMIYRWREELFLNESTIAFVNHEINNLSRKLISTYDYEQITKEIIELEKLPLEDQIQQVRSWKFAIEKDLILKKMLGRTDFMIEDEKYFVNLTSYLNLLTEQLNLDRDTNIYQRGDTVFRINLLHQFGIIQYINKVWEHNGLTGKRECLIKELIGSSNEKTIQPLLSKRDDTRLRSDKMNERIETFLNDFNLEIDKIKLP